MDCRTCEQLLADYLAGDLDETRGKAVEEHLAACPHCRRELAAERRLEEVLFARPVQEPSADFTRLVLARTRQEATRKRRLSFRSIPALAYAVSVAALGAGLYPFLSARPWALRAWLTGWGEAALERLGAASLPAVLEPPSWWSLPQTLRLPDLPSLGTALGANPVGAGAVAALIALMWVLYISLSENY